MSGYNANSTGYAPVGWTCQFCGKWVNQNERHDHGVITGGVVPVVGQDARDTEIASLRTALAAAVEALMYGIADDEPDDPKTDYGAWRIHARAALAAARAVLK